ncbi:hypothetical protein HK100_009606 [Physocladia obscura]|uniref:Uncharacterized protein n=1 Tax=Physocladia obscura TaxID=109957 RepID=A0AAD5X5Y4_9FUNG|nr:hypothetical protein HK100_009606 [Physocladia obscura]
MEASADTDKEPVSPHTDTGGEAVAPAAALMARRRGGVSLPVAAGHAEMSLEELKELYKNQEP